MNRSTALAAVAPIGAAPPVVATPNCCAPWWSWIFVGTSVVGVATCGVFGAKYFNAKKRR
jgi:hypothetical protein